MIDNTALKIATDFIAQWEGFRATPYQDVGGVWTIGFGFTCLPDGTRVTEQTPAIAYEQALKQLSGLVADFMTKVQTSVLVPITDNQTAALTSLAYNIGIKAFTESSLLSHLNKRDYTMAATEFGEWIHADGEVIPGLVNRRKAEAKLFSTIAD